MGMGWGISSEPQITRIKGLHGLRTSIALRVQLIDRSLMCCLEAVTERLSPERLVGSGKAVASGQSPVASKNPADVNGDGVVNQF